MAEKNEVTPQQAVIRHAQDDMGSLPPERAQAQENQPGMGERFLNWVRDNHAGQPSLIGQAEAMFREAMKDIRNTANEVFFGRGEHPPEMGTPQNPTPQNVTADLGNFHGYHAGAEPSPATANDNRSYGQTLADTAQDAQQQERSRSRGM